MDLKIFRNPGGRIYQLADEEKIKKWNAEMPLIFIGFIREKQLQNYPKSIKKEVEAYLDNVLKNIAMPKLVNALKSPKDEERLKVANNLMEISNTNPDLLKIALPQINKCLNDKNKNIADVMNKTLKNYNKAQKRKQTVKKRQQLKKLRANMDKFDEDFTEGRISGEDYLIEQKIYLKLKREIELAEQVD